MCIFISWTKLNLIAVKWNLDTFKARFWVCHSWPQCNVLVLSFPCWSAVPFLFLYYPLPPSLDWIPWYLDWCHRQQGDEMKSGYDAPVARLNPLDDRYGGRGGKMASGGCMACCGPEECRQLDDVSIIGCSYSLKHNYSSWTIFSKEGVHNRMHLLFQLSHGQTGIFTLCENRQ